MSLPSSVVGIAFSTATCTGGYKVFPFRDQGDTNTVVYYHEMKVSTPDYVALDDDNTMTAATQKPSRSPFADDADAFYGGDQSVSNNGDGLTTFIRVFARIPETRYDPSGLYAFDFSGVTTSSSSTGTTTYDYSMSIGITGYNDSTTSPTWNKGGQSIGSGNVFIGTTSGDISQLSVGDSIAVSVTPTLLYDSNSSGNSRSSFSASIIIINGSVLTLKSDIFAYQRFQSANFLESPTALGFSKSVVTSTTTTEDGQIETRNSPSRELKTYVKTSDPTSVTLINMTQLPDSLSASTTPTLDEYNSMVANGEYLNGAPETIQRFLGNIYEKSLIQVRAIS